MPPASTGRRASIAPGVGKKPDQTAVDLIQTSAVAFIEADVNHDQRLTIDEFKNVIPASLRETTSDDVLLELFQMADEDGSGFLTQQEYFFWTMRWTAENSGACSGLEQTFKKFDKTGDGSLNLREFSQAIEHFGFGQIGHQIFHELDHDNSGTVSYVEVVKSLKAKRGSYSDSCKRLLTQMSFEYINNGAGVGKAVETSHWEASSAVDVRKTLAERLQEAMAAPYDAWSLLIADAKSKRKITRSQFRKSIQSGFGYKGAPEVLDETFQEMDDDECGEVTFAEFVNWINGNPQRRKIARSLSLRHRTADITEWTEDVLRDELQGILIDANASTLDLVSVYDKSDDGELSKKEFLAMMKTIIGDADHWEESNIKEVSIDVFKKLSGEDAQLDIEELERWMRRNWNRRVKMKEKERANIAALAPATARETSVGQAPIPAGPNAPPQGAVPPSLLDAHNTRVDAQSDPSSPTVKFSDSLAHAASVSEPTITRPAEVRPPFDPSTDLFVSRDENNPTPAQRTLRASVSLPQVRLGRAETLRLKDVTSRAGRLRAAAMDAEDRARRAEARARRHLALADYAASAARAAEVERAQLAFSAMESARGQGIRRRLIRNRERSDKLAALPGVAPMRPRGLTGKPQGESTAHIPYW